MSKEQPSSIENAVQQLRLGNIIGYPTEAVYGLGCDPFNEQAFEKLLHVKHRPVEKGVILAAASIEQIEDLVRICGESWEQQVRDSWPGPVTWVLPVRQSMPKWVTGGRETLAVRVSSHPTVKALCEAFNGPIVSTSANPSGKEPARSYAEVKNYFGNRFDCIDAPLGELSEPTQIWDAQTRKRLR
ncbi:L-threonylcarbamoyladenylate synthase [Thiomicrorhabdus indica]|uniref:L-threonylcarbamoyladenylate synthase n=1 Tax=Thiomicrorhabdus indica TaxID=2267253 RepID=UPI002AA90A88|nr:L-threonylcarbamoyladenylate synthase [Thiomicrorhabdus indica]